MEEEEIQGQQIGNQEEQSSVFDKTESEQLSDLNSFLTGNEGEEETKPGKTADDSKGKTEAEENEEVLTEPVVDDMIIAQYPTLIGLKGKPLSEVVKSYDNAVRQMTKSNQQLKDYEAKFNQLKENPQQLQQEETEEELPDPLDNPQGFAAAIQKRIADTVKASLSANQQQKTQQQQEAEASQQKTQIIESAIKSQIEDSEDVKTVIAAYMKDNRSHFIDGDGKPKNEVLKFYEDNPIVLVQNVIQHYQLSKLKNGVAVEGKKVGYNLVKTGLQKNAKETKASTAISARNTAETPNDTDELMSEIFDMSYNENDWKEKK